MPQGVALVAWRPAQGLVEQSAARHVLVQELPEHVPAQNLQVPANDVQLDLLAAEALVAFPAAPQNLDVPAHDVQVPLLAAEALLALLAAPQNLQVPAHDVHLALLTAEALLALPAAPGLQVPHQVLGSCSKVVLESVASSALDFFYTTPASRGGRLLYA